LRSSQAPRIAITTIAATIGRMTSALDAVGVGLSDGVGDGTPVGDGRGDGLWREDEGEGVAAAAISK
jgi:hypothetical protein